MAQEGPVAGSRSLVHGGLAAAETGFEVLAIHGRLFPAAKGSKVEIQRHERRGWRTLRRINVTAGGAYVALVARPGSYRAVYRHAAGPARMGENVPAPPLGAMNQLRPAPCPSD